MRTMKYLLIILAAAAALAVPLPGHASDLGELRISYLEGDVQINNEETGDWAPAAANMPLRPGDRIWVPSDGRAEIQFRSGTLIRLDHNTSADVLRMEDRSSQFNINSGAAYVNLVGGYDFIQFDTPVASVRLDNRAKINIGVAGSGDTDIMVFTGRASAEDRYGITDVNYGSALVLRQDEESRMYDMPLADEWDRWNLSRDKAYSSVSPGSQYLPQELRSYSRDLDNNGRWIQEPGYGWVWVPRTVVSEDWAPYRMGRWVWMGGEYVWVSYESWGWAPYHYGRWAYGPRIGWFWVPPGRGLVYWGPGYVGWVRTSTYVSWVPLAPGEIYYGRGYYGPHSVNVININVNINKTVNVYRNVNVRNSVTVVNHQSFVSGHYRQEKFDRNRYMSERISIGGPQIQPDRNTRMPLVKEIRADRKPPVYVRQVNVQHVREERKLVRDRNISVIRPGVRTEQRHVEKVDKPYDRQDLGKERREREAGNIHTPERTVNPRLNNSTGRNNGPIKRDIRTERGKEPEQSEGDTWNNPRPGIEPKARPTRPESDTLKTNTRQKPDANRFDGRGDSNNNRVQPDRSRELRTGSGKATDSVGRDEQRRGDNSLQVKPDNEQHPAGARVEGRERTLHQETSRPVQQRERVTPEKHKPQEKNVRQEKREKPEEDAAKDARDNIKDEGNVGRHGQERGR